MQAGIAVKSESDHVSLTPDAIQEQLKRLLASSLFNHSRRYPALLRYVVGQTLAGRRDQLKERTIGINVFGRAHDYDLNIDPIVRVTAGEVRKRLAQYYYAPEHQNELRIELNPGSYIPDFRVATQDTKSEAAARPMEEPYGVAALSSGTFGTVARPEFSVPALTSQEPAAMVPVAPTSYREAGRAWVTAPRWLAFVLAASLLATASLLYRYAIRPSMLDLFWRPVVTGPAPVMIAVGSWGTVSSTPGDISIGTHAAAASPVALSDTVTIAGLQQFLSQRGKPVLIQTSTQTSFSDLQRGTTILISAFDNPWTMRLVDPLRFHFVARDRSVLAIEDREDPHREDWQIDTSGPFAKMTRDYAIIARFHDPTTEQILVVAAGIGENGTIAAGQALTNPQFLDKQPGLAAAGERHNIEAVIETTVIDGKSGPPRIVALTTW